jgi:predicted ATPase
VPETVEAVLMARLDRLPLADRQLLQSAAVIGRRVPTFLLWAVSDLSEEALRSGLRRLRAAEFLYEEVGGPETAHIFSHVLTQEVAYQSLPAEDRRRLHARIAEFLGQLDPARQAEHVEQLAHHCRQGELWPQAVAHLRRAGHRALARSAHRESAQCFEQALEAARALPEGREQLQLGIDLRIDLCAVLGALGQPERIAGELREAEALARRLGDQARLARLAALSTDVRSAP